MLDLLITYVSVTTKVSHELSQKMVPRSQNFCVFFQQYVWFLQCGEKIWREQAAWKTAPYFGFLFVYSQLSPWAPLKEGLQNALRKPCVVILCIVLCTLNSDCRKPFFLLVGPGKFGHMRELWGYFQGLWLYDITYTFIISCPLLSKTK